MFTYYLQVEHPEHMLFAGEIAEIYNIELKNILVLSDAKVHLIIKNYWKDKCPEFIQKKLFYSTRNGLKRVYPKAVYEPAMNEYCEQLKGRNGNESVAYNSASKREDV